MRKLFSLFEGALVLCLIFGAAACDETTGNGDVGPTDGANMCGGPTGDCPSCAKDGECCRFSINCQTGSICNGPNEPLHDPTQPSGQCLRVICLDNSECVAPKTCSLQSVCQAPVCQSDADCAGGNICLGGTCAPAPNVSDVSTCEVVSNDAVLAQGATTRLVAIAKNANQLVLPGIEFDWASDNTGAVAVANGAPGSGPSTLTGGTTSGSAVLSASVRGRSPTLACIGDTRIRNFAVVPMNQLRVIAVADNNGEPIVNASVTLVSGGMTRTTTTGADGAASFANVTADVDSLTVVAQGFQFMTVLSPGTKDLFLPIPRDPVVTRAGGFRGSIDLTGTRTGDIKLAIAGPSLPPNLLDFDFGALLGDSIPTTIDAPELGLNNEMVDLPGGVMLALGPNQFTDDSKQEGGGLRCQMMGPSATELGCYVARAPSGPGAAWVLGGQLRLAAVTEIAGQLSAALGGGSGEVPIGDILTAVLPLLQRLNHGVNPGLIIQEHPKINVTGQTGDCTNEDLPMYDNKCRGDFAKYQKIQLGVSSKLSVLSAVSVPMLPRLPDNKFVGGAILLAAADVPGRGLVPLGLGAGLDVLDAAAETPDGVIAGTDEPFGEDSDPLPAGQMPLALAPLHSGIEGSPVALISIALDPDSIGGSGGASLSGVVNFVERVDATANFGSATYLTFPTGVINVAQASFTPAAAVAGAKIMRYEIQRSGRTWLIYAPPGSGPVTFPNVAEGRALLTQGVGVYLQGVRTDANVEYTDVFRFGSGNNLDKAISLIRAFVLQECQATAGAPCEIR